MSEVTCLFGAGIELNEDSNDLPIFPELTILKGFGVEFVQQGDDIRVNDRTTIMGFSIEFVDFPIYAFQILTRRL